MRYDGWCAALALALASGASGQMRVDPDGVAGTLILARDEAVAVKRFVDLTGGRPIDLLGTGDPADAIRKRLAALDEKREIRMHTQPDAALAKGAAIWVVANAELPIGAMRTALARGTVVAIAGERARDALRLGVLPGVREQAGPGVVGVDLGAGAVLTFRGRDVEKAGAGSASLRLLAGGGQEAKEVALDGKSAEDLPTWQRAALARVASPNGPAPRGAPAVEKGALMIVGGGGTTPEMVAKFVELAGGDRAKIVILPTAGPDPIPTKSGLVDVFRKAGAAQATVLPQRTLAEVSGRPFLDALDEATGVWFGGGRQWRFVDAYEGTPAAEKFHGVLCRGGVIGGSSAGASIQGDYLCRGNPRGNLDVMCEGYDRGLAFLPGVGIDQHFAQRKRQKDLAAFVKAHPTFLGIGVDETTALVVRGTVGETMGKGAVHFYAAGDPVLRRAGERYDLKSRRPLP